MEGITSFILKVLPYHNFFFYREISEKAKKITFRVEKTEDLERDVFKSESAILRIPELDLELLAGTLGGVFTTVEGLINQVFRHLCGQ